MTTSDMPQPQRGNGGWWVPSIQPDGSAGWAWSPDPPPVPPLPPSMPGGPYVAPGSLHPAPLYAPPGDPGVPGVPGATGPTAPAWAPGAPSTSPPAPAVGAQPKGSRPAGSWLRVPLPAIVLAGVLAAGGAGYLWYSGTDDKPAGGAGSTAGEQGQVPRGLFPGGAPAPVNGGQQP